MKTNRTHSGPLSVSRSVTASATDPRRGAVLIVVMSLLGLLAVLGFLFYTFAAQEKKNSEYFADASKEYTDPGIDPDLFFDWALKQVIMGAPAELTNSALWGGRHSLMANMYGRDLHPFSGRGINIITDTSSGEPRPAVDQNFDGNADGDTFLQINDSPAARLTTVSSTNVGVGAQYSAGSYPFPDVDYTYPDINNLYLSYRGSAIDVNNRSVPVIIPSYHRPNILRTANVHSEDLNGNLILDAGEDRNIFNTTNGQLDDWYVSDSSRRKVLRAHPSDRDVATSDLNVSDPTNFPSIGTYNDLGPRYIRTIAEAVSLGASGPFPFAVNFTATGVPGQQSQQGPWDISPWRPNTDYRVGDLVQVVSQTGHTGVVAYECRTAGQSHNAEPVWMSHPATNVPDGTGGVSWEALLSFNPTYEYDVDADGDGIREAIWLDLDFPVQQLADGRRFIPMFGITVLDADGLLNLSVHGNIKGGFSQSDPDTANASQTFGYDHIRGATDAISQSNLGTTPAEVNVTFGLNARFAQVSSGGDRPNGTAMADFFSRHSNFFGHMPATNQELANMEFMMLKVGAPEYDSSGTLTNVHAGLYGDSSRLITALNTGRRSDFAGPGVTGVDDNNNRAWPIVNTGDRAFIHPLDYAGTGRYFNNRAVTLYNLSSTRFLWHQYRGYQNNVFWVNPENGNLVPYYIDGSAFDAAGYGYTDQLLDEDAEIEFHPDLASDDDAVFNFSELAGLQLVNSDIASLGLDGRLLTLMPFNLLENERAYQIRTNFTSQSWDLKTFGRSFYGAITDSTPPPAATRPWEVAAPASPVTDTRNNSEIAEFPAPFDPPSVGGTGFGIGVTATGSDPFRFELRKLLRTRSRDLTTGSPQDERQRKLSINHFLDRDGSNNLLNRTLTEHPTNPGSSAIPYSPSSPPPFPPTNAAQQEYWARIERQKLARDIYVLLYFYCGGEDRDYRVNNDVTGVNGTGPEDDDRNLYDAPQLELMAQFAINLVNSLDRDNVLDMFEYDRDLSDGWNLNDYPYDNGSGDSAAAEDRGVVYGIESQQLAFSEGLVVRAKKYENASSMSEDHPMTEFDDREDRYFSFLEIRNVSPFSLNFDNGNDSNTANNGSWRIVVETDVTTARRRRLVLTSNDSIAPGAIFQIWSAGDADNIDPMTSQPRASYFKVDQDYGPMTPMPDYTDRLIPTTVTSPNLDVIADDPSKFELDSDPAQTGLSAPPALLGLVDSNNKPDGSGPLVFKLQRRVHTGRTVPSAALTERDDSSYNTDNPWVTVDEMEIGVAAGDGQGYREFQLEHTDMAADWLDKFRLMRSWERKEPLARHHNIISTTISTVRPPQPVSGSAIPQETNYDIGTGSPTTIRPNSLGSNNTVSPSGSNKFKLWSPPGDRDYVSKMDLLNVPVYGPEQLTGAHDLFGTNTAGRRRFMYSNSDGNLSVDSKDDNRWYRLFSMIEVPTMLTGNNRVGVPGNINWNTMRSPATLAALIDDRDAINGLDLNDPQKYLPNDTTAGEAGRDWWVQFKKARDQEDPISKLFLPGTSASRPFRDFSYVADGVESINHTMLRELPLDNLTAGPGVVKRRLFELGNQTEHNNGSIDYLTRHHLISKMVGHSTTRSNVFYVFMQVDYFEVVNSGGAERIGAKLSDSPGHRGFFVIDRAQSFDQIENSDFKNVSTSPDVFTLNNSFDWRALVKHRLTIE